MVFHKGLFAYEEPGLTTVFEDVDGKRLFIDEKTGTVVEHLLPDPELLTENLRNQFNTLGPGELFRITTKDKVFLIRASTAEVARRKVLSLIENP